MINFTHFSPTITASDLDNFEQRFGFIFPAVIREQYLKYNGGCPDRNRFTGAKGTFLVHDFIPIRMLEKLIQWLKIDQKVLPDGLVPFANDPFGNFYCFSVSQEDFGAIFWCEAEGYARHRTEFLARSFDEFMANLKCKNGE